MKKLITALSLSFLGFTANASEVVGKLSGEFSVSSGNLFYTLPIVVPEGIHGLKPSISVNYSNSIGAGLLGAGFTLSASSSISRCNPNLSIDGFKAGIEGNANARFCLDGQKLIAINGQDGQADSEYRNVLDNNVRYFARGGSNNMPDYWERQDPDGFRYKYEQVSTNHNLFSGWYLTEKSDFFGNTIQYSYSSDVMPMLQYIDYSGYRVQFNYENREQPIGQYRAGEYYELSKRLNAIVLSRANTEINQYRFIYETIIPNDGVAPTEPLEKLKRLSQVEKCYGTNGQDGCLPPLTFHYEEQPNSGLGLDHPDNRTIVVPRSYYAASDQTVGTQLYERPSFTAADVNNDGYSDFCYYQIGSGIMCAVSTGSGGYAAPIAWTGNLGYAATEKDYSYYSQIQLIDLNADTYPDFCLSDATGLRCGLNNSGNGFANVGYWSTTFNHDSSPVFSFLDNDIYPDVCGLTNNASTYECLSGTGNNFSGGSIISLSNVVDNQAVASWQKQQCTFINGVQDCSQSTTVSKEVNMPAAQWMDIDGDIDNDLCWLSTTDNALKCAYRSTNESNQTVELSAPQTLYSFNYPLLSSVALSNTPVSAAQSQVYEDNIDTISNGVRRFLSAFRISDINNDLLPDVCYATGHQYYCSVNTGAGFSAATHWLDFSSLFPSVENDGDVTAMVSIRLSDMNLDGLNDFCIIKNEQQHCGYNQVGSFGDLSVRQSIVADLDINVDTTELYQNFVRRIVGWKTKYITGTANLAYGNITHVPDINGDAYPEFCYRSIHGILCTSNDNYGRNALLTGITDSFGQSTEITYGSLLSDGLYEAASTIPTGYYESPFNALVVDTVKASSAVIESDWPYNTPIYNTQSYRYKGFVHNPVTGVSGFSAVTVTQNERNISTTTHMSTEQYLAGRPLLIEEYIGTNLLKTKTNQFSIVNESYGRHRVILDRVEEKQYDLDGSLVSTNTTSSNNIDSYGYPQQATTTKSMAESGETLITVSETEFLHDTQNWLLAKPDLQTVHHQYQGETITRIVDYTYSDGLMVSEVIQPSASNASTISYTYDALGNTPTVTTSGNGQSRTINKTFDSLGRVLSLTNALGQSEHFSYHNTCPGVTSHTDVAGKVTQTTYDFACRQLQINAPDSNATTWTYEWATVEDNSLVNQPIGHPYGYRNPIVYKVTETHADGTWAKTYYDAQGRDIRNESVGFSSQDYDRAVVNDTVYDRFGRKTATTLPYYSINGEYITPSWITVDHDIASRIVAEYKTGADGQPLTTTYTYNKNRTTISYSDYTKATQTGVFGKPLSVEENGLTIAYTYDPAGNLLTTEQNGVVSSVAYDSRGFKVQQVDPAMGAWSYEHNAFGELLSQTDAKGQVTTFIYDELGRLIERTEPEGQTHWIYNTSGNGIGQLAQEQGIHATKQWAYDNLGRTISETLLVDSEQFVTQFVYDAYSRLQKTINPNGLEIHNEYDSTGAVGAVSIPASQIQGFDAKHLQGEYESVLLALLAVENDIQQLEERRAYHLSQSLHYQKQALHYAGLLDEVNNEIALLTSLAEEHEDIAARYQQAADDLRAQANAYRAAFGDRQFTYVGIVNGQYQFRTMWCSDRHKFWGGCKTYETRYVYISASNINTVAGGPSVNLYQTQTVRSCVYVRYGNGCRTYSFPTPGCQSYSYYRESDYGGGDHVNVNVCTTLRPHEMYADAAKEFEKLRDIELSKAAYYRDQIEKEGTSQLAPLVLVQVPTGVINTLWVPIDVSGITTFIPVEVEETQGVWKRLSLNETVAYYEEKIAYYTNLSINELSSYNELSREWENLVSDFGDLNEAKQHFALMLQTAGLLIGDDMGVEELITSAVTKQEQWENNSQPLMVWAATKRAANGLVENELFGNGLYTKRTVNPDTGLITAIETGAYSADTPLRKIDYTFDQRGMIIEKNDSNSTINNTYEQYDYDLQGRLRSWSFEQHVHQTLDNGGGIINTPKHNQLWRTYDYDDRGNMTYKTGAGLAMHYNSANQLTSRDIQAGVNVTYSYDANGNMTQGDGRTYQWNSFNKAETISNSGYTVNFDYDAGHRRVVKTSSKETIYYVSPSYEKVIKQRADGSSEIIHRHNIWNGHDVVASFEKRDATYDGRKIADDVKYYHRDHLGNGELVTGADMSVLAHRYYTPYGELVEDVLTREQNTTTSVILTLNLNTDDYMQDLIHDNEGITVDSHLVAEALFHVPEVDKDYRGFTSHEEIQELGLVNMNARLYDPVIGRFVSADTVITDISQPLDYNRYAYVRNNPMSYRDPTGNSPWWAVAAFFAAHLTDHEGLQQITSLYLTVSLGGVDGAFGLTAGAEWYTVATTAAAATATVTFLQTGDVNASVEAGFWSGISAGVANKIGDLGDIKDHAFHKNWVLKAMAHGGSQGVISSLRGDKFAAGFISGLAGDVAGHYSTEDNMLALSMLAGYIGAEATGGDGIQGALNAAFVFLYNSCVHKKGCALKPLVVENIKEESLRDVFVLEGTILAKKGKYFFVSGASINTADGNIKYLPPKMRVLDLQVATLDVSPDKLFKEISLGKKVQFFGNSDGKLGLKVSQDIYYFNNKGLLSNNASLSAKTYIDIFKAQDYMTYFHNMMNNFILSR